MRALSGPLDAQPYAGALEAVERILNREAEPDEALRAVIDVLHDRVEAYTWIGLYFVDEGELVLGPWKGESGLPEHTRLPLGEGAIGRSVAGQSVELLPDVATVPGYAACFSWTRAEIDVPVVFEGSSVAVIGIDSDRPDPFGPADHAFLVRVATLISAHCLVGWDTGGVPWPELG